MNGRLLNYRISPLFIYNKTRDYFTHEGNDIYLKLNAHKQGAIDRAHKLHASFDIETFNPDIALSQMHLLSQQLFK